MPFPWPAVPAAVGLGKSIWDWARGNDDDPITTTGPDRRSQDYIDRGRGYGQDAYNTALNNPNPFFHGPSNMSIGDQAAPFFNPFQDEVIGSIRDEFNFLRGQAGLDADTAAISQGAFGGSRAAAERGARFGELDRGQTRQIGDLRYRGYQDAVTQGLQYQEYLRNLRERQAQEPLYRHQAANQLYWGGLGPVGQSTYGHPDHLGQTFGFGQELAGQLGDHYGGGRGGGPQNPLGGNQSINWPQWPGAPMGAVPPIDWTGDPSASGIGPMTFPRRGGFGIPGRR